MPETENRARAGKREIPIPKPTTGGSDDVLRDESSLYGDEAELKPRRRKRTDARVPIMRDRKAKSEEPEAEPEDKPEAAPKKKKKVKKADRQIPKLAPSRKKKKAKRRPRRIYRTFGVNMSDEQLHRITEGAYGAQFDTPEVVAFTRAKDPTRLINEASGGKYLESVVNNTSLPTDPKCFLQTEFTTTQQARYYLYARVNCPSYDDDSYYVKVDNQGYSRVNGIMTNGQWQWLDLATFVDDGEKPVFMLSPGKHSLSIASRENGARLDRICISSYDQAPTGMGDDESQASVPSLLRPAMADDGMAYTIQGYRQPYPQHGLFLIGSRKVLLR